MYQPRHIANAIIQKSESVHQPLSQLRLQKLLYLVHGCYSIWHHEPLLPEIFEVWQYGPAIDSIFREYNAPMNGIRESCVEGGGRILVPPPTDNAFWTTLDTVWTHFHRFTDHELSSLSHCDGSPWQQMVAAGESGKTIPQQLIVDYFKTMVMPASPVIKHDQNVVHVDFGIAH